jgi:hypothetical protein
MKSVICLTLTAVLCLTPISAFAQKTRTAPQVKQGQLTINVTFQADWSANINRKSGDRSTVSAFASKVLAVYKHTGTGKATRRGSRVSMSDWKAESTRGQFSFDYNGKVVERNSRGVTYEMDEKGAFSGAISEAGTGSFSMDGVGDNIQEMEVTAGAEVRGYFQKTTRTEKGAQTDRSCASAAFAIGTPEISSNQPDPTKPPEQACVGRMLHSTNVYRQGAEGYWAPLKVEGGFAVGFYKFSFTGSIYPVGYQKNEVGDVQVLKQTLSIEGNWAPAVDTPKKNARSENRIGFEYETAFPASRFYILSIQG